jgi:cytoskeletal protein RodZ
MKKNHPVFQEIGIWLRGRFSLTGEEKFWLLLFLIIVWFGLLGRYLHLKNRKAEPLSPQQVEEILQQNTSLPD